MRSVHLGHLLGRGVFQSAFTCDAQTVHRNLYVTDTVPLSTWATFEHDRRELCVYMLVDNCDFTGVDVLRDQTQYVIYKLVIDYDSVARVIYDARCTSERTVLFDQALGADQEEHALTHNLYLTLAHPPQLWRAVPRSADADQRMQNRQNNNCDTARLNYKRCGDWERVANIVGKRATLMVGGLLIKAQSLCGRKTAVTASSTSKR